MAKQRPYRIGLLGLSTGEVLMLKSLERILATRPRPYTFAAAKSEDFDIYIVNSEDPTAVEVWKSLRKQTAAPAILVAPDAAATHGDRSVKRPLIASRMLGVLDEVTAQGAWVPETSAVN